jgi:hypothetical protein
VRDARGARPWPVASPGLAEPGSGASLADVLDRILDKGVVINADIAVSVVGVELLGIKLRAAVASFETAARYGLEFPTGVDMSAPAWRELGRVPPAVNGDRPAMPAANSSRPGAARRPGAPEEDWHDGAATEARRDEGRRAV